MKEKDRFATYPSLRDRVVLVTGGATGIGAAIVEEFAFQGSRVAFLDIDGNASSKLIADISPRSTHPPVFLACDLTDIAALRAAVAQTEATLGAINVLVGILLTVPLLLEYLQYGLTLPRDITTRNHLAVMGFLLMVAGFMSFAFTLVLHAALDRTRHE